MPRDDERAGRDAVRAFGLVVATLANPVPGLMADFTAPEERLRELKRELPLVSFSPFGTLPDDIAYYRGEPAHPPAEATRTPDPSTGRETLGSGARQAVPSGGDEDLSRAASPEARPPVFSFRRNAATGTAAEWRARDTPERPMDTARGQFHVSGTAQEDPERLVNSALQDPSAPEHPEATFDHGNEDSASGTLLLAGPMSLLDDLAEEALGATRYVPLYPANAQPRIPRSRESGARDGEAGSVEGLPVSVDERLDTTDTAHLVGAVDPRKAGPDGGGVDAMIGSLVEDLFSPPARTPDDPLGMEAYAPEVADRPREPLVPDRSTFGALNSAFDEPDGGPSGTGIPDDEGLQRVPEQYADPEALADLINDVLVRQARRHGVDLS
jgi:hypothetical protein